jgi:hypothetical protein
MNMVVLHLLTLPLLLLLLLLTTAGAEDASCPCLSADTGALDSYKLNGQLYYDEYAYPNDYGRLCFLLCC